MLFFVFFVIEEDFLLKVFQCLAIKVFFSRMSLAIYLPLFEMSYIVLKVELVKGHKWLAAHPTGPK